MSQLHVQRIEIYKLFRQYHHTIDLHQDEHVTILHGRNGVGKTVTLSLVEALLRGDYQSLLKFPYEWLKIEFTNGTYIKATQIHPTQSGKASKSPRLPGTKPTKGKVATAVEIEHGSPERPLSFEVTLEDVLTNAQKISRDIFGLERIDEARWIDRRAGDVISAWEVVDRYGPLHLLESFNNQRSLDFTTGNAAPTIPVHFIQAQRLLKLTSGRSSGRSPTYREGTSVTTSVRDLAQDMASKIQEADSRYRSTSTQLDNTLPSRLFVPASKRRKISLKKIEQRVRDLEKERTRLRTIGLISDAPSSFDPGLLTDEQLAMFSVYLEDSRAKLLVFEKLADKTEIILNTINRKFSPKTVELHKDQGYIVYSHDRLPLDLAALSSGEQHELVLMHNLLFRVQPGTLLLIDEPELSLHVTWQREFLADLLQIVRNVGFDVLMATHSPYIVGTRDDLMVPLK